jgi:hypothetical protein
MKAALLTLLALGGIAWYVAHVTDTDAWIDGACRRVGR